MPVDDDQFRQFVAERLPALRGAAYLMCGSWAAADDLVQNALIKSYLRWGRINSNPEGYVRRVLVTLAIDETRRPRRREQPTPDFPDVVAVGDPFAGIDASAAWQHVFADMPPRQRAVVTLRYWFGLDPTEVADLLDCSVGTVKSQSARGLDKLRTILAAHPSAPKEGLP